MQVRDHMPHVYARRLASKVAHYLKRRYGATRVLLYGSLALGVYNPDFSDIDVCFEGVRESLVADALADCKRNFKLADSSGRVRLHCVSVGQLASDRKSLALRGAEEI